MLDQVIYTRCMPQRVLKRKGEVSRQDGFGVFSMSPSIVDGSRKIDFDHLQSRLVSTNAAKEDGAVGLIHSYEYLELSENEYALTYEFARPHCLTPRKNGKTHRKGTYIKQSLVGQLKGYPCDFFGASCWTAHLKSENDYYLDDSPNPEPDWLPQVNETPQGGYITLDRVRAFVQDGRAEAVKTALWFLLQEYGKPVSDRKVLLIKDVPANVELWIAAIEHAFSAPLARQITFSTNKSKLANQTDTALFYYTDSNGRFYAIRNAQLPVTRKPYCMIVGYHPMDKLSESLRQLPASNFVILDGVSKVLNVETDERIRAPYFQAVVQYDADIEDFCTVLLPSLPLKKISSDLPELFDAYKYLLDSNHKSDKWTYADTLTHLNQLTRHGLASNEALNQYLLDECVSAYSRFAAQDENAKYPLLQVMWKLAAVLHREAEVHSCAAEQLIEGLQNLGTGGAQLRSSWRKAMDGSLMNMLRPVLLEVFADKELPRYTRQFQTCDVATVCTVVDIYLATVPNGVDSIMHSPDRLCFLTNALVRMAGDRREATALLQKLSRTPNLFNALAISVSEQLAKTSPANNALWWNTVTDIAGGNVVELCRKLITYPKTSIDLVEKLLTDDIRRAKRCSRDAELVFSDAAGKLGCTSQTGKAFFYAWIEAAEAEDTPRIIAAVRRTPLSPEASAEIFHKLDRSLPYDIIKPAYAPCVKSMEDWATAIGIPSRKIAFAKLRRTLEQGNQPVSKINDQVAEFAKHRFQISETFYESDLFQDIVICAGEYENPQLTYLMLSLFDFADKKSHQNYVNAYVECSLDALRGHTLIEQMLYLTDLAISPPTEHGGRSAKRMDIQLYLESALKAQLPRYAKGNMADRIDRMEKYPPHVRAALIKMLRLDDLDSSSNPLNDILGGLGSLFRRR